MHHGGQRVDNDAVTREGKLALGIQEGSGNLGTYCQP